MAIPVCRHRTPQIRGIYLSTRDEPVLRRRFWPRISVAVRLRHGNSARFHVEIRSNPAFRVPVSRTRSPDVPDLCFERDGNKRRCAGSTAFVRRRGRRPFEWVRSTRPDLAVHLPARRTRSVNPRPALHPEGFEQRSRRGELKRRRSSRQPLGVDGESRRCIWLHCRWAFVSYVTHHMRLPRDFGTVLDEDADAVRTSRHCRSRSRHSGVARGEPRLRRRLSYSALEIGTRPNVMSSISIGSDHARP